MRKYAMFLYLILMSLSIQCQNIALGIDTLYLDVKNHIQPGNRLSLTHAIENRNAFYCIFKEEGLYSYKRQTKHLVRIDITSGEVDWVPFPAELKDAIYFDFFQENNFLYIKNYHGNKSYAYSIENNKWNIIDKINDVVYFDDKYKIAYQDHGEWGEYTWFLDIDSNSEYILKMNGEQINRIGNDYYLTLGGRIVEVFSPEKLSECHNDICYFTSNDNDFTETTGKASTDGYRFLYNDSIEYDWDLRERNLHIYSSWVVSDTLYHLYSQNSSMHIGRIKDGAFISDFNLPFNYKLVNPNYTYRGRNKFNDYRFHYYKVNENNYGLISLKSNLVRVFELFHNQDSLKYIGENTFVDFWSHANIIDEKLMIDSVQSFEETSDGTQLFESKDGQEILSGLHPQKIRSKNSACRRFVKTEDEHIAQVSEYHYDTITGEVKSVFLEWCETNSYEANFRLADLFKTNEDVVDRFRKKYDSIKRYLTEELGIEPMIDNTSDYYEKSIWEIKNHQIKLYIPKKLDRNPEIRLVVY